MTDVDVLPFDTSWLSEPTTGVHQFGGGSELGIWVAIAFLLYTAFSGIKRYLDIRREDRRLEKLIQENRERSGPD
jgi:hypothetical protein